MKPQCKQAVRDAAAAQGRELTDGQIADIDSRMARHLRELARTDKDWQAKSTDQRFLEAAERAMSEVHAEAARKVRNAELQVLKTVATQERIETQARLFPKESRSESLARDMVNVDTGISALKAGSMSRLMDLIEAAKDTTGVSYGRRAAMWLWDVSNPEMTRDLAREIYRNADGATGNHVAQEGAKAWLQVIDEMRQRFNAAGGDVGKLDYGYAPIVHDWRKVRGANDTAAVGAWVSRVLGLIDRDRYVDEDGRKLTDAELTDMLGEVWKTISTDGLNKQEPGAFKGSGARANRGSEHRVLHFRDGDAYLDYLKQYGRGSMFDLMTAHVGSLARDIGLTENYGPNPNAQMRLQFDLARMADGGELKRLGFGVKAFRIDPEGIWRTMNGTASSPKNDITAMVFQHLRNVQSLKLAGTFLKMFPDLGTYIVSTGFNKLGYWDALRNLGTSGTKAGREFAAMHGLMADSAIRELNRFMDENIKQSWSARLANSQMKLTLGETWTNWLDRAYGLTKMGALGRLAGKDWGALTQWDRALLERKGVTAEDWQVVRAAKPDELNGVPMLTPDAIIATGHENAAQVADKILGVIRNEVGDAVIKPDLYTRTAATFNGLQAGTALGETARAVMQFKSFPIAMITRHWRTVIDAPRVTDGSAPVLANRAAYIGALTTSLTALGAISYQATQIATGKDPIDPAGPHALKFWVNAFATGGAGGFYSDLLTRDTTQDRSAGDALFKLLGPTATDIAGVYQLTKGNTDDYLAGKPTHTAAQTVQFARGHLPYVNMWYTKAALDHAFLHSLQENVSPGYLERMQAQAAHDWGQQYWWRPGTGAPERAPDFAHAVGE